MALQAKQIYQQSSLEAEVDTNNTYFVVDMLDATCSGKWLTYRLTCQQLKQIIACTCLVTVKTVLTSAQILNLDSSPVTLVPAMGAGTVIQPISSIYVYTFVTTPYDGGGGAAVKTVNNGNKANTTYSDYPISGVSQNEIMTQSSGGTQMFDVISSLENQDILAWISGTIANGDGTLTIYTSFTVITI